MTTQFNINSLKDLSNLYDKDFYLWLQTTAKLLQNGKLDQLDIDNLIEEIESMGRKDLLTKCQLSSELFPIKSAFTLENILNPDYLP